MKRLRLVRGLFIWTYNSILLETARFRTNLRLNNFGIGRYWCRELFWSRTIERNFILGGRYRLACLCVLLAWATVLVTTVSTAIATAVAMLLTFILTFAAIITATSVSTATDFVNNRDNNRSATRLVVKNVRQLILNFLLYNIEVDLTTIKGASDFLLKIRANNSHKLFAITQVNEATANDVRARH